MMGVYGAMGENFGVENNEAKILIQFDIWWKSLDVNKYSNLVKQ